MANQALYLFALTPLETLQLLEHATAVAGGEGIAQIRYRGWSNLNDASDRRINLVLPDPGGPLKPGPRKLFTAIADAYEKLAPDKAEYRAPSDNFFPLSEGLAELLAVRASHDPPAPRNEREYMLVVRATSMEQAAALLTGLAAFSTSVATLPQAERTGGALHLFHILHDRQRGSPFQALVATGFSAPLLVGYETGAGLLFAHEAHPPGRTALTSFAALLRHAPNLLGPAPEARQNGRTPLAALVRWPDDEAKLDLLHLRNAVFASQVAVEPHQARYGSVAFADLRQSVQAEAKLREAINAAAIRDGLSVAYTLTLRKAPAAANDLQRERARLQAQQEDLANRLEYLDSIEPPRPRLLRFTEEQLPALGDFVGSLSMRVLETKAVGYAFQSLAADGAGMHYLLVDPRTAPMERMDPLPAWDSASAPPIRFWLDPYWAPYYQGHSDSLVFVPQQHYLSPMMHPANPNAMDEYLRTIVGQWFEGRPGHQPPPRKPLYVFEPFGQGQQLTITVLDAEDFVPLSQKLDWVNAHLHLRTARKRGDEILRKLDDHLYADELLNQLQQAATRRDDSLRRTVQQSADQVAAATGALTDLLCGTLDDLLERSDETRKAIAQAQQELRALIDTQAAVAAATIQTTNAIAAADGAANGVNATTEDLRRKVDAALAQAESAHAVAERRIIVLTDRVAALRRLLQGGP